MTGADDGAATDARLCNSSAVIQWLPRKAMKRFLALLINTDLWAMFAVERGHFSSHIFFLLLFFHCVSLTTNSMWLVFTYVHEGPHKRPFVPPVAFFCTL